MEYKKLCCSGDTTIGDNLSHLAAIADLSRRYSFDGVDILPYHNMGVFKSQELGREPWGADFISMSDETKQWVADVLMAEGCEGFQIL